MAEITHDEIRDVCDVFLPVYNAERGGNFELDEQIPVGSYADFFIVDKGSGRRLPVQHVRAMENPRDDVVKPQRAGEFVQRLMKTLESDGVSGVYLTLSVRNLPKDLDDLAIRVSDFVQAELHYGRPAVFRFDEKRDFDRFGLRGLVEHVPTIEICRVDREGVVVGFDCADVPTSPHLDDQQVIEKAIEAKRKKYGRGLSGTILLVEAWPLPFWSFYTDKARQDRDGDASGFEEIWAVSSSGEKRFAARIA